MSNLLKMMAGAGVAAPLYVDDVFVSYVRTGTGAEAVITTNIDMAEGYTLWSKGRSGATDHAVYDSARGVTLDLVTNSTAAATTQAQGLKSVSTTGHTIGTLAKMNTSAATYVDWVFRFAPNFHEAQISVKSGGSNATASFPGLGTLGMVAVKRTDSTGSWYVWHRSLTAGKLLYLEQTAAEATLGHITVSGTTVTLVNGVITDGTYIVYAWAHDATADGLIQCGTFTTDGSGNATVELGWEPQYILLRNSLAVRNWNVNDSSRGMTVSSVFNPVLAPDNSNAENLNGALVSTRPTATGFTATPDTSATFIYLAIRRPNKPPTVGTQVYNAIARTGTGAAATVTGVGFAPDLILGTPRPRVLNYSSTLVNDRLRGVGIDISTNQIWAELAKDTTSVLAFTMDGVNFGVDNTRGAFNWSASETYINWFFRRAPGFFDEVCYTGTGAAHTEAHNLGVVPELMIVKMRSGVANWMVGTTAITNAYSLRLNTTIAAYSSTDWNNTSPTGSVFSLGTDAAVNLSTETYVAYLFATLAGISKVGSYTGTAATLQINCGFTTGARFVLIKRTDSTGDWYVWDTVRGIIAGDDPYLLLNSTAAEVTTTDYIDPYSSGFEISSTAPAAINASGGTYIYLAIA